MGGGVQGGCEWRSEAFVKIQKKKNFFFGGGGVGGSGWMGTEKCSLCENSKKKNGGGGGRVRGSDWGGCQGGWEQRIEAYVKIQKKKYFFFGGGGQVPGGGIGFGVRVDVNGEVKFL